MTLTKAPTRNPRLRRGMKRAVAASIAAVIALGGAILATTPAVAATGGTGYGSFDNSPWEPYKGTFQSDGMFVICAEAGRSLPQGDTLQSPVLAGLGDIAGLSSKWGEHPNISENQLAGINRVLNEHAATGDPAEAAGLEYAIANVLYPDSSRYTIAGSQMGSLDETINYDMYTPSGGNDAAIQGWAHALINDINSTAASYNATGSGQLNFAVDLNAYPVKGTVTMAGTAGSVGSITLTNAVFSNGSATISGVTAGQVLDIIAAPPADGSPYQISGTGNFTPPGGGGYLPQVQLLRAKADVQSSIGAGPRASATPFDVQGFDPNQIAQTFNPILSTNAVQYVEVGQKPTDEVTFGTGPNSAGVNAPWPTVGGNYAPIVANGTLYGPFASEPAQSPDVPAGAPVAGHASVTASQADGPNVTYTATSDTAVTQSGFYTWVWEINAADQRDTVKRFLTPDYAWHDDFGQKVETSLTPMYPELTSTVNKRIVAPGENVTDHLNIYNSTGVWLTGVSATFTGKAYSIENGTAPTTSNNVPSGATPFATVSVTVTKPGEVDSPAVTVPQNAGHIVWVWSFDANAQSDPTRFGKDYTWQDQWALSSETSVVQFKPTLTSQVSSQIVNVGDVLNDKITTSVAEGQWIDGTTVVANGTLYGPLSAPATESATVPNGTPVAGVTKLNLTGVGTFETDSKIVAKTTGYYVWVWSIEQSAQTGTASQLLPAGYTFVDRFGLAAETSLVPMRPVLTSKVNEATVTAGQKVTDHLTISNASGEWLTGVTAKFTGKAYAVTSGAKPATSDDIPAGLTPFATVEVTVNKAGEVDSPSVTIPNNAGYIVWVWSFDASAQADPAKFGNTYVWQDQYALAAETSVVQFKPTLTSKVSSRIVQVGDVLNDTVTTAVSEGQWIDGTNVIANGTLYGPLTKPATEATTVPNGTPVAGEAKLTLTGIGTFETDSKIVAKETGYYVWVWSIEQSAQKGAAAQLIPTGYKFVDRFGLTDETSIVPMHPELTSKVNKDIVHAGEKVTDHLTIRNTTGEWLTGVEAKFVGRAYSITSGVKPTTADSVPAGLAPFATVEVTVDKAGEVDSPSVTVPKDAGYIVWVWSFDAASQADPEKFGAGYTWQDRFALDAETSVVQFKPVVTTQVSSKIVKLGEEINDVVTSSVVEGQWIKGTKVTAQGTLYGPFLAQPDQSNTVPSWAPIAGTAELTFNGIKAIETKSGIKASESGFYTWVWEIHQDKQTGRAQELLPKDYSFVDDFAQIPETSITPSGIIAESAVTKPEVALGEEIQDTLTVHLKGDGGWLQNGRDRIPVTFRGTAYWIAGDKAPEVSATVPAEAVALGTTFITASKPGTYTSKKLAGEDYRSGWITWVWEIRDEDQPENIRGMVAEWSDGFGLPSETQRILMPKVTTKATPEANIAADFEDVAKVTGTMPVKGADLHFELYSAVKDENGNWVCEAGNLLWTSETKHIAKTGEYRSGTTFVEKPGDYFWVEVLTSVNGNEISRGICGLPDETTTVVPPKVTTKAQTDVAIGEPFTDTAIVEGKLPATEDKAFELHFELYAATKDENGVWVCDAGNLLWTSTTQKVWGDKSEYISPEAPGQRPGDYHWVEVLTYKGNEVHRGVCGLPNETTTVVPPKVTTKAQTDVTVTDGFHDTAIVTGKLPSTKDNGLDLHFELYAATKNEDGTWVCEAGNLLWTSESQKVWGKETEYVSPEAPGQPAGTYHWVEVLTYQGEEIHRGICGLPDETTTVIAPDVTTKAQAGAKKGESIQDTAIITGPIPKAGAELTFEAYNIPMVQDGDRWVPNRPEGVDAADWSWVATPENLIGDNLAEGQVITKDGEYLSPEFVASEYGKVLWVETLWTIPAENPEFVDEDGDGKDDVTGEPKAERQIIHRGEIGIPNETSFIVDVSTVATSDNGQTEGVEHGVKVWDTAQLVGYVPENGTVEFEAYLVPDSAKADITKACTEDTLTWTSPKVTVEGGLYTADKPLLVTGEAHVFDPDVDSQLYWVEVTRDALGREVSRGVCGDENETVGLKGQRVIRTDGELPVTLIVGGIALLAALGAAGAIVVARRRNNAS